MNRSVLLVLIAAVVVAVTVVSFIMSGSGAEKSESSSRLDKAGLLYRRGENFIKSGELDEAVNAFIMTIKHYPGSVYTEKALRKLAAVYREKEDNVKVVYYYKRLLQEFPHIKDADEITSRLQKLNMDIMMSPAITEDSVEYEVQPGDSLYVIANKFNTTVPLIKKINRLNTDTIRVGQRLKISVSKFSVFVDKSDNTLVLSKDGAPLKTYTISTGKDNCTPVGKFTIVEKSVKPPWYRPDGKLIMPDSPEYELGERWMALSVSGYGIHGTNDEKTIGGQVTMGCVRMRNKDVIELFEVIPVGTEVEIVD